MCPPYSPDCFRDFSVDAARDISPAAGRKWRLRRLALAGLGVLDIWLLVQLMQAIDAMLAQDNAPLISALAAAGCALETGAALLLTWLLIEEGTGEPTVFSQSQAQNLNQVIVRKFT